MELGEGRERPVNKKKILVITAIALVVFLLAYIKLSGGNGKTADKKESPGQKPAVIKTASVVLGNINPSLSLSGSVVGDREVVITAKSQGIVTSLGARTGQQVSAGQVVAVLENNTQQLTMEKSREQLAAASTALEKARTDFDRISQLYSQGAVSKTDYENSGNELKKAQTAYNVASSDSQMAGQALKDTAVVAPFSGSVAESFVEEGEMVFPGTRLMTVVSDTGLKIKAGLTADKLKLVAPGQKGLFSTMSLPGKDFSCEVKTVSSRANSSNLTYSVEITLPGDAGSYLKSGMFGHVKLEVAGVPATIIPREALLTRDEKGEAEVFLVKDGRAFKKIIKTGLNDDMNIAVMVGLQPGDKVVTFGQSLLKESSPVTEGE